MSNLVSSESPVVKATISTYQWCWQGQPLTIADETDGVGEHILLLPAFSTVSSRTEMSGLAACLRSQFQVTTVDFPGFGDSARPRLDYAPPLYRQFLADYNIEVQLSQSCVKHEDKCVPLKSGQPATAEIAIRNRRIIDFVLDPFRKLANQD
jgi:hypothetical protein